MWGWGVGRGGIPIGNWLGVSHFFFFISDFLAVLLAPPSIQKDLSFFPAFHCLSL